MPSERICLGSSTSPFPRPPREAGAGLRFGSAVRTAAARFSQRHNGRHRFSRRPLPLRWSVDGGWNSLGSPESSEGAVWSTQL
jgi:hypothetical protein